jgi:hypothetical protein
MVLRYIKEISDLTMSFNDLTSVVTVNPLFCMFYLVTSQFVALGVHLGAVTSTVTSTGRGGLKLEQAYEHKSHNPFCRFYGRGPDGVCRQWCHAVEV